MLIRIFNPLKLRNKREKKELTVKIQESTNCKAESTFSGRPDDDDIITSLNSDVNVRETVWHADENRLVARKHFVPRKRSLPYSVGSFGKLLKAYGRLVSFIALYLAIVTNVLGGLANITRYGKKSTVGNSDSLPRSESSGDYSCCHYSLSIFRKCLDNILRFNKELWSYGIIYPIWKKNKPFRKGKEELWKLGNTLIFRLVIAMSWLRNLQLGNVCKETFCLRSGNVAKTFLAGKCFRAYLRLFADFCAPCCVYSYIYTVNLEFEDKFKRIYDYIYLYIYDLYCYQLSYEWASYPGGLAVKTYTLVYFSSKASLLMIKSHDKYQSIDLIGLAHVEKAYSKNRLILVHNRSYWRELRPLVTPWAWCIKEGIEPWRVQKWPFLSHVQVSLLPLSLLSFSCSAVLLLFYYYCYYYLLCLFACKGYYNSDKQTWS